MTYSCQCPQRPDSRRLRAIHPGSRAGRPRWPVWRRAWEPGYGGAPDGGVRHGATGRASSPDRRRVARAVPRWRSTAPDPAATARGLSAGHIFGHPARGVSAPRRGVSRALANVLSRAREHAPTLVGPFSRYSRYRRAWRGRQNVYLQRLSGVQAYSPNSELGAHHAGSAWPREPRACS
jgi:hypothetical protein